MSHIENTEAQSVLNGCEIIACLHPNSWPDRRKATGNGIIIITISRNCPESYSWEQLSTELCCQMHNDHCVWAIILISARSRH